ncbi:MAG: zinc-dependent metalloprotease [Lutibacter sp.]|uniref:zinc-dependent metalloprotease n=1 Tax=Lutibacter sp. TaxID=1925666 RepID=UPI00179297D1|nr:zinc-dependent metalloprotease [Lutibacter sp.]MBT8317764.1 zinc-dependent metalloprotease [Lutibacter sp.]NNJ58622.1 zinc-dependent metalloprotease [Lutibacter sp.]
MKQLLYIIIIIMLSPQIFGQSFQLTKNLEKKNGYFNFYYNDKSDKMYLEVANLNKEFLYLSSLSAGVGSNDIGLDRGQLGQRAVVKFIKAGNKLLLIQPNLKYRAITSNLEEKKSVEEAFAQSVLFGFKIEEQHNETYLIDISSFLIRDEHGVSNKLRDTKQGNYSLDLSKSAFYLEQTKAFPKNTEFEAILTFKGEAKGGYINSVAPNSSLITVRQHHSFIELPDANFKKRIYDPRSGANSISYLDYATPIESPIVKRYTVRHRLEKVNPKAEISEAKEPIIYYLDRGTPEPVRSALLEGGSWWNQAFEAIGYKNAFQFKILPEGADMLDIRYNVVQWVHRSTRGWSYGASVVDPRTGEILKGHVSLGSLRIRQDYLIAQALLGVSDKTGDENPLLQMALARIRQLSVHEIGHTLGFTHNFASSFNGRASVMDYPHPYVKLTDNNIDLSEVYSRGIGEWDKVSIAYSYQDFQEGVNEESELNNILQTAIDKGLLFISDRDARAAGGSHINAHLWDNGTNAAKELDRVLKVRAHAIRNFSDENIKTGEPFATLEDVFVPLYFFHRYQVEAASKMIGGMTYSYAVKGDGQAIVNSIDPKLEREALESILNSISVETLKIPERIVNYFPPRPNGYGRTRESFKSKIGVAFDPLNAASTATELVVDFLFHPERVSRLVQQKAFSKKQLGLDELIGEIINSSFKIDQKEGYDFEIQHSINHVILQGLLALAASDKATFQSKSIALAKVKELKNWLGTMKHEGISTMYANGYIAIIDSFLKEPAKFKKEITPKIPEGSPIGSIRCDFN